jgi:hypothetical protein
MDAAFATLSETQLLRLSRAAVLAVEERRALDLPTSFQSETALNPSLEARAGVLQEMLVQSRSLSAI